MRLQKVMLVGMPICWVGIPRIAFFEDQRSDTRFNQHLKRLGHPDGTLTGRFPQLRNQRLQQITLSTSLTI